MRTALLCDFQAGHKHRSKPSAMWTSIVEQLWHMCMQGSCDRYGVDAFDVAQ